MCEMCQEEKDATYVLLAQCPWKAPESTGMDGPQLKQLLSFRYSLEPHCSWKMGQ